MKILTLFPLRITIPLFLLITALVLLVLTVENNLRISNKYLEENGITTHIHDMTIYQGIFNNLFRKGDIEGIQAIIADMGSEPNLIHIALFDQSNKILYSNDSHIIGKLVHEVFETINLQTIADCRKSGRGIVSLSSTGDTISANYPILIHPQIEEMKQTSVAVLHVCVDLSTPKAKLRYETWQQHFVYIIYSIIIFVILGYLLRFVVSKRAAELVATSHNFSEGDHSVRSKLQGNDELARIAFAMNQMFDQIIANQNKLSESQLKYRQLFDSIMDSFVRMTIDGNILECNPSFELMLGYSHDEITNLTSKSITPDKWWKIDSSFLHEEILPFGFSSVYEKELIKKDGSVIPVELRTFSISNAVSGQLSLWSIVRDITERKKTELILQESETKLRAIFESSRYAIGVSLKGIHVLANPSYLKLFGYDNIDSLIGTSILDNIAPDFQNDIMQKIQLRAANKNLPSFYETRGRRNDGHEFDMEVNVSSYNLQNEKFTLVTIRDITERKNSEELLLEQNKNLEAQYEEYMILNEKLRIINFDLEAAKGKAEESDKLKTAFLQNISHEIRTPLNGIIGFSNLLNEADVSKDEITEYSCVIKQSGKRLIEIVNNVIDISKIETGMIELNIQSFSLNALIEDLYEFFLPMAELKSLKLNYIIPQNNESSIVSDESKIVQILTNLINNAIKFTFAGSINFGYKIIDELILFFVEDSGIGIPDGMNNRIFERFVQVDLSITRGYEGAGLGLAISKGLVELLGGYISFKSELNKGTKFEFSIPYSPIQKTNKQESLTKEISIESNIEAKILIAEDDFTSFRLLQTSLKNKNYELILAENGQKAVEMVLHNSDIDIVFMDIRMPVMDGFEATRQIKKLRPQLPVIAQTAYAFSEEKMQIMTAGFDDYISKPIDLNKIKFLIEKFVNKQK
ncbi:MAG: PAS domain S-box protein [Candidatus Kapabacteria bacterium]|nr:PAS domain S-box protein [Candidatus Kapabacteria bacterium]